MEAFADPEVNEITCLCSAQSAKTLTMLVLLCWAIAEDPGPILWVTVSGNEAKKIAKSPILPLIEKCDALKDKIPTAKGAKNTQSIYFPGAPFIIAGAGAESDLQSTPFRYIFLDEARQWQEDGKLEMVSKRTRSYHNYKKVIITCPDKENDGVHRAFLDGDQRQFEVPCPHCGTMQHLEWGTKDGAGGVKWDMTDEAHNNGVYNWELIRPTIRYCCKHCGEKMFGNAIADRKRIQRDGKWRRHNELAAKNKRSYTWGVLLPWWTKLEESVAEFLSARKALSYGDAGPLKVFFNETLGLPWQEQMGYTKEDTAISERAVPYSPSEKWDREERRFCTIDVQEIGRAHV